MNMVVADGLVAGWYWKDSSGSGDRSRPFGKRISTAILPPLRIPCGCRCAPRRRIPIIPRPTASPEAPRPKSSAGWRDRPLPILHDDPHRDTVWINALLETFSEAQDENTSSGSMRASTSGPRFRQAIASDVGSGASRSNTCFALSALASTRRRPAGVRRHQAAVTVDRKALAVQAMGGAFQARN